MHAFVLLQLDACPFVGHLAPLHGIYKEEQAKTSSVMGAVSMEWVIYQGTKTEKLKNRGHVKSILQFE